MKSGGLSPGCTVVHGAPEGDNAGNIGGTEPGGVPDHGTQPQSMTGMVSFKGYVTFKGGQRQLESPWLV